MTRQLCISPWNLKLLLWYLHSWKISLNLSLVLVFLQSRSGGRGGLHENYLPSSYWHLTSMTICPLCHPNLPQIQIGYTCLISSHLIEYLIKFCACSSSTAPSIYSGTCCLGVGLQLCPDISGRDLFAYLVESHLYSLKDCLD